MSDPKVCIGIVCIGQKYLKEFEETFKPSVVAYCKKYGYDLKIFTDFIGERNPDLISFEKCLVPSQLEPDVKAIVLVTHTVPNSQIIEHDLDLIDTYRFNSMGNSHLALALNGDTENKIKTWCFGHYHRPVDTIINGIRYISNPRGRGDTEYSQVAYYPKRISIKI